jgi:hypothetical protein
MEWPISRERASRREARGMKLVLDIVVDQAGQGTLHRSAPPGSTPTEAET